MMDINTVDALLVGQQRVFREYQLRWTGWKALTDMSVFVSQWIGWPINPESGTIHWGRTPDHPFLYVNMPGLRGGPYQPGECFDLTCTARQGWVTPDLPDDIRQGYVVAGLERIRELIGEYWMAREEGKWNR